MKIELKCFTTNARLSQETTAFAADVWVNGKLAGYAKNDGHGGATMIHLDRSVRDQVEARGKELVPAKYKALYSETEDTCGTALSLALKEATTHKSKEQAGRVVLDVEALWKIAARNKIDTAKYVDLNNGQKRMNVYNRMVGMLNNGQNVHIGSKTFKAEDWVPRKPKPAKAKPAKAAKAKSEQPQAQAA